MTAVEGITPAAMHAVPYSIGLVGPALLFLMLGYAVRHLSPRRHGMASGFAMIAIALTLSLSDVAAPVDLKAAELGTPVVSLLVNGAISVGLLLVGSNLRVEGRLGGVVSGLARASLVVVLTHAAVLYVLATPASGNLQSFIVALVLPWLAGLVLLRTRFAPITCGTSATAALHRATVPVKP